MSAPSPQHGASTQEFKQQERLACVSYIKPQTTRFLSGRELLASRKYNKGTAFSKAERRVFQLEGLLPPVVSSQKQQSEKIVELFNLQASDLMRYNQLMALQGRNQKLFYHVVQNNVKLMMPIIYTPTVGEACMKFGSMYNQSRGMYISLEHKGQVANILRNWESPSVRAIVFTDGQRILGLGDLGAYGMGIPLGKLGLYTALGGIDPNTTLPVTIDVGTNNETLLNDPHYTGLRRKREEGPAYDELIDEFIQAARMVFGQNVLLQFEDFGNANAFRLLRKYINNCCCFNDDIQGTAGVVTAGVLAALPVSGKSWAEHTFLFFGAGSAGLGIADLIAEAFAKAQGITVEQARKRIWCTDSKGLVFKGRASGGMTPEKLPFAHEWSEAGTLGAEKQDLEVYIKTLGITGIFGVSAQGGAFTSAALKQMAENCERPIVFALSNPTSKAECTAAEAYEATEGRCWFASGSPFQPVTLKNGEVRHPGQGNNSYVFPGVALGILCVGASRVTTNMFLTAAEKLASLVSEQDLAMGSLYPPMEKIRQVSAEIAAAVAAEAYDDGVATVLPRPKDLLAFCTAQMWSCDYATYVPKELEEASEHAPIY